MFQPYYVSVKAVAWIGGVADKSSKKRNVISAKYLQNNR